MKRAKGKAEPTVTRVRIAHGWDEEGREGQLLAQVFVGQLWSIVLWDDMEDPDCFKAAGLERIVEFAAPKRKPRKKA